MLSTTGANYNPRRSMEIATSQIYDSFSRKIKITFKMGTCSLYTLNSNYNITATTTTATTTNIVTTEKVVAVTVAQIRKPPISNVVCGVGYPD